MNGNRNFQINTTTRFICRRSGTYSSQGTGKRQLKTQGSKKIGYSCTAQLIVKVLEKEVIVDYYKNHYKHDFLLSHLPLPDDGKQSVAAKFPFLMLNLYS